MVTHATVFYGAPGPKAQRFNRTLTWVVAAIAVAILAWVGMKLVDKSQFEPNKRSFFLESTTWTTYILPGLVGTIIAAMVSIALALATGASLGVGKLDPITPIRWLCSVIVEFFRAIPMLVLMLFTRSVSTIRQLFPSNYLGFAAVVSNLTAHNGSVIGEMLRSGIESLPKDQQKAVTALGLSHRQTMVTVLLPQVVVAMLSAIISQVVVALKDSTLGYVAGYVEVVRSGHQLGEYYDTTIPSLVVVAIILIAIDFGLANLAERIES